MIILKKNLGIACPGCGYYACNYSYGILLGLYKLNIFQKINYISTSSGSSWLTIP